MAHKPVVTGGVNGETPQPVRASVTPKHQKTKSQNKPPNMGGSAVLGCSRLSFILFISGAVNILLALLYLSVRPWSRVLYRRVTGKGPTKPQGLACFVQIMEWPGLCLLT